MHIKNITFQTDNFPCRDVYPFHLPFFQDTRKLALERPVTIFVGENGSGKSTLLQAIARACGIHIWQETGRTRCDDNRYEDRLCDYISVTWSDRRVPGSFFGSETFRHFRQVLDEWAAVDPGQLNYFGGKSLMTQSHGESLMSFFTSRYAIKGLYLLDEPETALSPRNQMKMLDLLSQSAESGHAQFIMATHSPILLACPGAILYNFDRTPIEKVRYEETEHYRLYKDFLEGRRCIVQ